jgi:hypothetical protein
MTLNCAFGWAVAFINLTIGSFPALSAKRNFTEQLAKFTAARLKQFMTTEFTRQSLRQKMVGQV